MKYFPIFIDLDDQPVLVVGGGEAATQKIRLLLKTNAKVTVVAEDINDELACLETEGRIAVSHRAYQKSDLEGRRLVYAATNDTDLNHLVSIDARAENININVVDETELCSFITPAIVDRDPVTIAIGTDGSAPILAREIKAKLEAWLPFNYGRLADIAGKFRKIVELRIPNIDARRHFWEQIFSGPFRLHVLSGDDAQAEKMVEEAVANNGEVPEQIGQVSLVGCGPGDTDLLTLKAQQRLQAADVLVIDRLVNPEILEYARRDADRIYVGKTPGIPSVDQEEINRILLREALAGKLVVRLKGGDPFVFGRAVEEMIAIQSAGIPIEVVPGITAAQACAASIGLPLTSRGKIRKLVFLTGATADNISSKDWLPNVERGEAAAIYMGVRTAPIIQQRMLNAGLPGQTPIVIVERGTMENERIFESNVASLESCVEAHDIKGPAIIFVGIDWESVGLKRPKRVHVYNAQNIVNLASRRNTAAPDENS